MRRVLQLLASFAVALAATGCSTASLVLTAAGIATDTSITWEVAKHVHDKLVENDPTPCLHLNSVQRAITVHCDFTPGSIRSADIARSGLQSCPLLLAVRDTRLWRAVPELMAQGARAEHCHDRSPLVELAGVDACPDFAAASPEVLEAFRELALYDSRAVRHDVFRMLSCPKARSAGLDRVLAVWLRRGNLAPGTISFSPLNAAHPDLLVTRFGRDLEAAGHTPRAALDGYIGTLPGGFEEALRTSHWPALEWWLARLPRLASSVPPSQGGQLAWVPLQRVLVDGWLHHPAAQRDTVAFLLARGADPRQKLPFDTGKTVIAYAAERKSPHLALLDPPRPEAPAPRRLARTDRVSP